MYTAAMLLWFESVNVWNFCVEMLKDCLNKSVLNMYAVQSVGYLDVKWKYLYFAVWKCEHTLPYWQK